MTRSRLLPAALALLLSAVAPATADSSLRVAAIRHGEVVVLTPGGAPEQLTHTGGKLLSFTFSRRGDLAAATSTRLLVRTAHGTRTIPFGGGYAPPPAWSPDGRYLVVFIKDALHVYDADADTLRTVPLPRIPLRPGSEIRWAIFGLVFGQSAHDLYVLGLPAADAPADQGRQAVYRIDPTAAHPKLRRLPGQDLLGNVVFENGAISPGGRYFAAPLYVHEGGCDEPASIALLDLQQGRWLIQLGTVPGTAGKRLPGIGSVGWADDDTLLFTAKPYTQAQCFAGSQWKVPATLYRQPRGGGPLTTVEFGVNWFAASGDVRVESRCPHWPVRTLRQDPSCDASPVVLVQGGTRTTLPLRGGPVALLPGS